MQVTTAQQLCSSPGRLQRLEERLKPLAGFRSLPRSRKLAMTTLTNHEAYSSMAEPTTSPSTSTSESKRKADDSSSSLLVDSIAAPITSPPPSDIVASKRRKMDDSFGKTRLSSSLEPGPSTGDGSTKVEGSVPADPEQDNGEEDEEKESTPKLKPRKKKEVKKQLVDWDDIKEWKEGDDPLGRFPAEVLVRLHLASLRLQISMLIM
jgi:hypothetical protein